MPLDHYIPQVYLKNFYDPKLGKRMHALRKSDLGYYRCDAYSQCRRMDGNTNHFLTSERAIEEFLKTIEPDFNQAVDDLRSEKPTLDAIYAISGLVAYIATCSPTAMRIHSDNLQKLVQHTTKTLDEAGHFETPPESLNADSLAELIERGDVRIDIDEQYPQAMGIDGILRHVEGFGNFDWIILTNHNQSTPFITSDYPIALERSADPRLIDKIIPLAPDLAVHICPNFRHERRPRSEMPCFQFPDFRYQIKKASEDEVLDINAALICSAEDAVYFPRDDDRIRTLIKQNRHFRTEMKIDQLPMNDGMLQISGARVLPYQQKESEE